MFKKSWILLYVMMMMMSFFVLVGCSDSKSAGEEPKVEESKDNETDTKEVDFTGKTLNVVATSDAYVPVFEKFTQATGAKVEFLSMSSGEVLSRVKAEGDRPMADLWFGGGLDAFLQAKEDGLLESYISENASDVPDQYKDPEGFWYSKGITIVGLLVNHDVLDSLGLEAPTSWEDLTKPEYEGEIIMSNPAISGTNYAAVKGLLDLMGEEEGWAFLEKMNQNIPYYSKRGRDPQELTTAGEFAIGIIPADKSAKDLQEEHPVEVVFPQEGIPWVPEGVAIFKNSENTYVAKAFIDFMYTPEIMKELAEIDGKDQAQIVKPNVEGMDLGVPSERFIEEDLSTFGTMRKSILDRFTEMIGNKAQE